MDSLFSRVDIAGSLEDLLMRVATNYRLGSIQSHKLLPDGYQELNVLVTTTSGRFVVKIFSKEKSLQRVQDNVWGYLTFKEKGVPMPVLQQNTNGEYILSTKGKRRTTHLCVTDYFDGSYLHTKDASDSDIRLLAEHMATIHSHTKRIHRYYDTMGLVNLLTQYKKFRSYLSSNLLVLVEPVVKEFSSIHLGEFRHSIIHGTFESKNILKNKKGELCLLDLGCMDYNASIVDVATFLANYTIDMNKKDKQERINLFLTAYQTQHPLTAKEVRSLPILIRAQYATIVVRTNYYIRRKRDTSSQTRGLFAFDRRGLTQTTE